MLSAEERTRFDEDGFFLRRGFAREETCAEMLGEAVALARAANGGGLTDGALVMPENNLLSLIHI